MWPSGSVSPSGSPVPAQQAQGREEFIGLQGLWCALLYLEYLDLAEISLGSTHNKAWLEPLSPQHNPCNFHTNAPLK